MTDTDIEALRDFPNMISDEVYKCDKCMEFIEEPFYKLWGSGSDFQTYCEIFNKRDNANICQWCFKKQKLFMKALTGSKVYQYEDNNELW